MKIQRLNINYSKLLTPYIVLQPIIDILIFYFLTVLENPLTPGLIIRNLALVGVVTVKICAHNYIEWLWRFCHSICHRLSL